MWSWNQFKNLPKNQSLSAAEKARQYFIHQSNMMMEASSSAVAAAAASAAGAGAGAGGSRKKEFVLILTFDDINNVTDFNNFSGDFYSINDWNRFFDLPEYGTPFTTVEVNDNIVKLSGGSDIIMRESLFDGSDSLLEVNDTGCIIELQYNVFGDNESNGSYELVSVNFPNVTAAGDYCFYNCESLVSVNLPNLITAGDYCFYECQSLTTINLPRLTTASRRCFEKCYSLTTINLPLCTDLGGTPGDNNVFSDISQNNIVATFNSVLLTNNGGGLDGDIQYLGIFNSLTINNQLYVPFTGYEGNLTIEFNDIENADILVGDSSNVEDWNTFFDLPAWSTPFTMVSRLVNTVILEGGQNILINQNFLGNETILSIIDQGCICYIEDFCFTSCNSLTIVDLPLLTNAGEYCFQNCNSLTDVSLPALTTAGDQCFIGCISVNVISLPALTTAGSSCFQNCNSLTDVSLPQLVTAGDQCFYQCAALTDVSLPQLTTAGSSCFQQCTSLEDISLPQLTTAGNQFFAYCNSLTDISLPQLVTVGNFCFFNCPLTTINLPLCTNLGGSVSNDGVFSGISNSTISLTIPAALMTCNDGDPDGDIVYLQENNEVTIIEV
jgi:hypothetical protein